LYGLAGKFDGNDLVLPLGMFSNHYPRIFDLTGDRTPVRNHPAQRRPAA
jgi:hypothetical protein